MNVVYNTQYSKMSALYTFFISLFTFFLSVLRACVPFWNALLNGLRLHIVLINSEVKHSWHGLAIGKDCALLSQLVKIGVQ